MAHSLVSRSLVDDDRNDGDVTDDPHDLLDRGDLRQGTPDMSKKRVVILIDLDCYEVQVWVKEKLPDHENLDVPIVVVNLDRIILAVNYTARLLGVNRGKERGHLEEMERKHPQLVVIKTGELFGRQDVLTPQKYSDDILQALLDYQNTLKDFNSIIIQRSSKDEIYIDVTNLVCSQSQPAVSGNQVLGPPQRSSVTELTSAKKTHPNAKYNGEPCVIMEGRDSIIYGPELTNQILNPYPKELEAHHADETSLAHGAVIALELVKMIKNLTGFDSSAGVAHNKLLAKFACDRNKPQGITILSDLSIPRIYQILEFKGISGYGGDKGKQLLKYFAQSGRKVLTCDDIVNLPIDALIEAFKKIGSKKEVSLKLLNERASALRSKCQGQDDSIVEKRHFTDTISASTNFKGAHSVRTWNDFEDRVKNLSLDLSNRIKYNIDRWNRSPHSLVVEAKMSNRSNVTPRGGDNSMKIDGFVDKNAIYELIMQHMSANSLEFGDIEDIKVTGSGFKVSTVDGEANITEAQDRTSQSIGEDSSPGASKSGSDVKTMSNNSSSEEDV